MSQTLRIINLLVKLSPIEIELKTSKIKAVTLKEEADLLLLLSLNVETNEEADALNNRLNQIKDIMGDMVEVKKVLQKKYNELKKEANSIMGKPEGVDFSASELIKNFSKN